MNRATIWAKANSGAEAWRTRYGTDPARHVCALMNVMIVGFHETELGITLSGNWGAVQRRAMTTAERAMVRAGIAPPPTDPFEVLHGDSSPETGVYRTWFWAFPPGAVTARGQSGDVAAADKLLETLLDHHRAIGAAIDHVDLAGLAAMMYAAKYFEGTYDPRATYELRGGVWTKLAPGEEPTEGAQTSTGGALDVAVYARGLAGAWSTLSAALVGWTPGAVCEVEPAQGWTWQAVQTCLNALGASPPLVVDGLVGPATRGALHAFQVREGLLATSLADDATIQGLRGPEANA